MKQQTSFVRRAGEVFLDCCREAWYNLLDKSGLQEVIEMENRFEFVEKNGIMQGARIIVDKQTGVQYLLAHWTNIGGLTVLVDKDGKPLLDPKYAK